MNSDHGDGRRLGAVVAKCIICLQIGDCIATRATCSVLEGEIRVRKHLRGTFGPRKEQTLIAISLKGCHDFPPSATSAKSSIAWQNLGRCSASPAFLGSPKSHGVAEICRVRPGWLRPLRSSRRHLTPTSENKEDGCMLTVRVHDHDEDFGRSFARCTRTRGVALPHPRSPAPGRSDAKAWLRR
jgi:hypothetical protein